MAEPETHEEAVDRIFDRVAEERAERLAKAITEVEIDEAMAALNRAERLRGIQMRVHAEMVAKYGRALTAEESNAMTRAVVKGRLPGPNEMEAFEPAVQQQLHLAAAEYAQRIGRGSTGEEAPPRERDQGLHGEDHVRLTFRRGTVDQLYYGAGPG